MNPSVLASWYKAKEGKREELQALLQGLVDQSKQETGCLLYELYEDRKASGHFFILEKWDSRESFGQHAKQPFLAEGFQQMEGLLEEPYKIVTYKLPE